MLTKLADQLMLDSFSNAELCKTIQTFFEREVRRREEMAVGRYKNGCHVQEAQHALECSVELKRRMG